MDRRFGRCPWFILHDSGDNSFEAVANPARDASGGAGGRAVQELINRNVSALIAAEIGPKAADAIEQFELDVYLPPSAASDKGFTVNRAVELWKSGALPRWQKAPVRHFGDPS
jgi:predicted Fe-Mo cluster-binding NifX family protein